MQNAFCFATRGGKVRIITKTPKKNWWRGILKLTVDYGRSDKELYNLVRQTQTQSHHVYYPNYDNDS